MMISRIIRDEHLYELLAFDLDDNKQVKAMSFNAR